MNSLDEQNLVESLDVNNLSAWINSVIQTTYAENFDPIRYAFIEGLVKRLNLPNNKHNKILLQRVGKEMLSYMRDFEKAKLSAQSCLEDLLSNFPDCSTAAETLFAHCEFKKLSQLAAQLARQASNHTAVSPGLVSLRDLNRGINEELTFTSGSRADGEQSHSLDELLIRQEAQLDIGLNQIQSTAQVANRSIPRPLRSMKLHSESTKRLKVDQIITRSISNSPENPGPHNPQMLAIDALSQMRELSPKYLRRFASYIDSLSWLEKSGLKLSAKK